jgi:hypothetical protein
MDFRMTWCGRQGGLFHRLSDSAGKILDRLDVPPAQRAVNLPVMHIGDVGMKHGDGSGQFDVVAWNSQPFEVSLSLKFFALSFKSGKRGPHLEQFQGHRV